MGLANAEWQLVRLLPDWAVLLLSVLQLVVMVVLGGRIAYLLHRLSEDGAKENSDDDETA